MSVLVDARQVADAVIAAVSAAIAVAALPDQRAYSLSEVPGTNRNDGEVPELFAQVQVERRFDESAKRAGAPAESTSWRVVVGAISGQSVREADWVIGRATTALEDVTLATKDGHEFRCRFQSYRAPEWDDGSYWGSATFTCAT